MLTCPSALKRRFQGEPKVYEHFLAILEDYQQQLFIIPRIYALFNTAPDILDDVKRFLPENTFHVEAAIEEPDFAAIPTDVEDRSTALNMLRHRLKAISRDEEEIKGIRIENCVGFTQVPLGLAGPLSINGEHQRQTVYAPLATVEPTLVAACSRGCKAFQTSGGVQAIALSEGMSRAPVFGFSTVDDAVKFHRYVQYLKPSFQASAEGTSRYAQLIGLVPHIIGKTVHVKFVFTCGDATGQNMVTIATHRACLDWMKSADAEEFRIVDFQLEGQLSSDKKLSWGNVQDARGVEVLAWGKISNAVCQRVLGCTTATFYQVFLRCNDGSVRNGQMGQNANTANIMTAMFIACGQDAASVLECGWSHLTTELDSDSQLLTLSLYFPSMAVGTVGGGTQYPTQREALELIGCSGPGKKHALAETVAAFALALEVSTIGAFANDTFAKSHMDFARAPQPRL
jgi:NADP-dependent 3-hydroxy-3-methylglutaryl-CoA reductase